MERLPTHAARKPPVSPIRPPASATTPQTPRGSSGVVVSEEPRTPQDRRIEARLARARVVAEAVSADLADALPPSAERLEARRRRRERKSEARAPSGLIPQARLREVERMIEHMRDDAAETRRDASAAGRKLEAFQQTLRGGGPSVQEADDSDDGRSIDASRVPARAAVLCLGGRGDCEAVAALFARLGAFFAPVFFVDEADVTIAEAMGFETVAWSRRSASPPSERMGLAFLDEWVADLLEPASLDRMVAAVRRARAAEPFAAVFALAAGGPAREPRRRLPVEKIGGVARAGLDTSARLAMEEPRRRRRLSPPREIAASRRRRPR